MLCLIHHILDDFLFAQIDYDSCLNSLTNAEECCDDNAIPLKKTKREGPAQILDFTGITLNTLQLAVSLPHDKVTKYRDEVKGQLLSKSVRLRHMQRVVGMLNFACKVVPGGRAFL